MKSERNKTLDISASDSAALLSQCIAVSEPAQPSRVLDRTICGDCFSVMPLLPEGFADLVIADPPYNLNKDFDGGRFKSMRFSEYADYTLRWLTLVKPLLKSTGSIYVCCDWHCSAAVQLSLESLFKVRSRITWQREKGRGALKNWKNGMEDIWFATVSDDYTFNLDAVKQRRRVIAPYKDGGKPKGWQDTEDGRFRDTCPSNFWDDITVPYWSMAENTVHPTQKPEKLLAKLILASSNPGDTVFDPFLGSGSSSVTAKKLGRRYTGIEQSERYCAFAEKRLSLADTSKSIQGFSGGVFWERNSGKL